MRRHGPVRAAPTQMVEHKAHVDPLDMLVCRIFKGLVGQILGARDQILMDRLGQRGRPVYLFP